MEGDERIGEMRAIGKIACDLVRKIRWKTKKVAEAETPAQVPEREAATDVRRDIDLFSDATARRPATPSEGSLGITRKAVL